MAKKILIYGDFSQDRLGASYERAFQFIGYNVLRYDVTAQSRQLAWPARNRILHRAAIRSFSLRSLWSRAYNRSLVEQVRQAAVPWILLLNGDWIMPETIRAVQRLGSRVALFHADNPFPPHYNNRPETLEVAKEVDIYLIWSRQLVNKLEAIGVKKVAFLSFGWDEVVYPYLEQVPQGSWPGVTFVGGWDSQRETFLEQLAEYVPLRIHGPGYWGTRSRRGSRVREAWSGRPLLMKDAAKALRESAIALNILRTQHVINGYADGVIMRHFEVPGAGGFLLSTRSTTATELFPEGETGVYFSDVRECVDLCRYYIEERKEREDLVKRSHEAVFRGHTYAHRAQEIIALTDQFS